MVMISAIDGNLLKIRGAVIANVPFLFIRGKVHHWWRYSSMSATRTCELLFQILGRSGTVLSVDVHDVMKEDQALGQASQEATCVDVFGQCNVHLFQGFCTLGSRLQTAVRHGSGWGGSRGGPGESRGQTETYSIKFPRPFKD